MGRGRHRSRSPREEGSKRSKKSKKERSRSRERKKERRRSRSRSPLMAMRWNRWRKRVEEEDPPSDAKKELLQYIKKIKSNKPSSSNSQQGSKEGSPSIDTGKASDSKGSSTVLAEMKATEAKLDEEMRKRRERIEAWRASKQKEAEEVKTAEADNETTKKGWTLEDDDDSDEEGTPMDTDAVTVQADEDDLDTYMKEINQEVKKIKDLDRKKLPAKPLPSDVVAPVQAPQKDDNGSVDRGELLHNDQDHMEYSSEEEDMGFSTAIAKLVKKHKKKELPKVNHSQIEYEAFRKSFYVEVPELARMTDEEVKQYRESLENIQIKGKMCPKPAKTWAQCGLSAKILEVLKKNSYERPTPIQAQAIPAVMSGRDLIGVAKTGSGKTLAFVLPMLRHIMDQPPLEPTDGPIGMIMTPTRELALQIYNETRKFCKSLYLNVACIYGGTGISEQIAGLKRGAEIIVCTPGRMIDMLAANSGRVTNLHRVTYLVLDEADRMFDMGFEPQVTKIVQNIRPDRQTVLFSATFPRQMEALARKILDKPIEVQVGGRSVVCRDVEQHIVVLNESEKFLKLLELLGLFQVKGNVLVFVEKQDTADHLFKDLLKHGYPGMSLHGGMDQFDRDSTIADFKNGTIPLMIATSVAARGLDVKNLILVVNFDCPNHYEDYVHRCGRTGRAGNKGFAYTFITYSQEKMSGELIKALQLSEQAIPKALQEVWDLYTKKLKEQGKEKQLKKRRLAIGFCGKGFKFNEEEAAKQTEKRLIQKTTLREADDDDEGNDELSLLTIDKILEKAFSAQPRCKDPSQPQIPDSKAKDLPNPKSAAGKALAAATAIADKISQSRKIGIGGVPLDATQTAASDIMKGGSVALKGAALASQIAAGINARVGGVGATDVILPAGVKQPGDQEGKEEATEKGVRYEVEVEINDFPQQVRWRLTNRDNLDTIAEYSEAGITVRGQYVSERSKPKEGEKKLHLALEAGSERSIQVAKQELKQLVMEEITRMASSHAQNKPGKYSVV